VLLLQIFASGNILLAQPTLEITSHANNTIVSPGQTIKVTVNVSGGALTDVALGGELFGVQH
jgi:sporulation-control protein spo0M